MNASIRIFLAASLLGAAAACAASLEVSSEPDSLVLRDGHVVRGLIVRNARDEIVIQTVGGEETYPKTDVARIHDAPGEGDYLVEIARNGTLPPWRTLINDLRNNDRVTSLEQIPATTVNDGVFKNVPYLSFRINKIVELDIYGDPNDPAGIELGIYGMHQKNARLRRVCREFMASYLNTRGEIEALYRLNENGGKRTVDGMTVEYTPANAPDAYGAWWVSIYNEKHLDAARLTDAQYAKVTAPMDAVLHTDGMVRNDAWNVHDNAESLRLHHVAGANKSERIYVRGFYRDKDGNFRVITAS
jgi:hypothetical protein